MLCDNLLEVLEQSGYLTPEIATARPCWRNTLALLASISESEPRLFIVGLL